MKAVYTRTTFYNYWATVQHTPSLFHKLVATSSFANLKVAYFKLHWLADRSHVTQIQWSDWMLQNILGWVAYKSLAYKRNWVNTFEKQCKESWILQISNLKIGVTTYNTYNTCTRAKY